MTVSFIDGTATAFTTATTTFAIPAPTSGGALVAGDVLVANIAWDTATTAAIARTLPAGWVTITGGPQRLGTGTVAMDIEGVAHVITAAEASAQTASWAMDNGAAYVGNVSVGRYRGVDSADLLAVSAPAAGYSLAIVDPGASSKIAPLVTVDTAGSMLVTGSMHRSNSTTISSCDTGYAIAAATFANAAGRAGGLAHKAQAATGDSTTATWVTSSINTGAVWQTALKAGSTGPTAPTVSAGADVAVSTGAPFTRTATESDGGATITARAWTIVSGPSGAGTTIGTAAALSWTPTVDGTYVLRYSATNSVGTGTDDVTVTASTPPAATPVLVHRVLGIPTTSAAYMTARTTGAVTVRMQVCPSSSFASGVLTGASVAPNAQGDALLTVSGLTANTAYYQRVAMTNSAGTETFSPISSKTFTTAPAGQASYSFSFASCDSASDTTTWTTVANRSDPFFLMLGDMYYADGTGTDLPNFRAKMTAKIQATNHVKLLAATPTAYTPSDHDGMNNGSTAATDPTAWANWNTAYRELWPAPGIPATTGAYRTFTWGRVRYIQLDTRSFSSDNAATDNSSKTRLGATQKQWLKDTITAATEPVIVLVQADPWIGTAIATGDTGWLSYNTERQELGSFFAASGKNIALLAGDMHAVAADDGTSVNNPGHIAVFHGSPMQNTSSLKGGPFTVGPYPTSAGVSVRQYARITVTDTGSAISLDYRAYDDADTQLLSLTKTYAVAVPTGTASGAWSFTGTASGAASRKGSATGTWGFSGAASGTTARQGTAAGSYAFAGSATGTRAAKGTAAGVFAFTGTAAGVAPIVGVNQGTAAGTWAFVGTASGTAPATVPSGTATGTWTYIGAATGTATHSGTAAGTWGFVGHVAPSTREITVAVVGTRTRTLAATLRTRVLAATLESR